MQLKKAKINNQYRFEEIKTSARILFGSILLDCLSIFNVFMHCSNAFFPKVSENNNSFLKKYIKKVIQLRIYFFPIQH